MHNSKILKTVREKEFENNLKEKAYQTGGKPQVRWEGKGNDVIILLSQKQKNQMFCRRKYPWAYTCIQKRRVAEMSQPIRWQQK